MQNEVARDEVQSRPPQCEGQQQSDFRQDNLQQSSALDNPSSNNMIDDMRGVCIPTGGPGGDYGKMLGGFDVNDPRGGDTPGADQAGKEGCPDGGPGLGGKGGNEHPRIDTPPESRDPQPRSSN